MELDACNNPLSSKTKPNKVSTEFGPKIQLENELIHFHAAPVIVWQISFEDVPQVLLLNPNRHFFNQPTTIVIGGIAVQK